MKSILFGSALVIAAQAFASEGTVLTFEKFNPPVGEFQQLGPLIYTKGFTLQTVNPDPFAFVAVDKSWVFNRRSTALTVAACDEPTTLTKTNNYPFGLRSVDIAEINGSSWGAATVTFTGTTPDGETVSARFVTDGKTGWQTFKFSKSFRKVQQVVWYQSSCYGAHYMIDNLVAK